MYSPNVETDDPEIDRINLQISWSFLKVIDESCTNEASIDEVSSFDMPFEKRSITRRVLDFGRYGDQRS